jgi:hypothetical protein
MTMPFAPLQKNYLPPKVSRAGGTTGGINQRADRMLAAEIIIYGNSLPCPAGGAGDAIGFILHLGPHLRTRLTQQQRYPQRLEDLDATQARRAAFTSLHDSCVT